MDTVVFKNPTVQKWTNENVVFLPVNGEADTTKRFSLTDFAKGWNIAGYPTFILVGSDGVEIERFAGTRDTTEIVTTLTDYIAGRNTLTDYLKRAESGMSAEIASRLAEKYSDRNNSEKAAEYLRQVITLDSGNAGGFLVQALFTLGMNARGDKQYDTALTYFSQIVENYGKDPVASDAWQAIGGTYRRMGDTAKAIEQFEKWFTMWPGAADSASLREHVDGLKSSWSGTKK